MMVLFDSLEVFVIEMVGIVQQDKDQSSRRDDAMFLT